MDPLLMFIYECHSQKQSNTGTDGSKKPVFLQPVLLTFHSFGSSYLHCGARRQSGFTTSGLMHSLVDQLCIGGGALGISWNKKGLS